MAFNELEFESPKFMEITRKNMYVSPSPMQNIVDINSVGSLFTI
jgi:hypothetical protein